MKKEPFIFAAIISLFLTQAFILSNAALSQDISKPIAKLGPNIVENAGFEKSMESWNIPSGNANVVDDQSHSGEHSLHYKNNDPKNYKLFSQRFKLTPGQKLQFSAWIKVADISGGRAAICMQSYDANGKYLSGSFASGGGFKGTHDWQQTKSTYTVPDGASTSSITVYITKNGVGDAWFDDVEVRTLTPPPFISFLQYPNYRNTVKAGDNTPWKYQVQINADSDWKNKPIEITNTLTSAVGKVLLKKKDSVPASQNLATISLNSLPDLSVGEYTLIQHITDPNGKVYLGDQQTINVVEKMPKVYIDTQGFTVIDGKRFFPMGLYLHAPDTTDENLARIAAGGFNTILTYDYGAGKDPEAYMERAANHGLHVLYKTGDSTKYVKLMRENPALLGWYTSDEPIEANLPELRELYKEIQQNDFNHPTFLVQNKLALLAKHFDNTDILGVDPYPVGDADLTQTTTNSRAALHAARGAKGVWVVAQLMNWANYPYRSTGHWPTLDEMRNQTYQAIINGAKGMLFYSYYNLMYPSSPYNQGPKDMEFFKERWSLVTQMSQEIKKIIPVILENKKVELDLPKGAQVEVGAWEDNGKLSLMLANPYYETKSITFALPQGWQIKDANQGEIKSTFANGKVTFTLPSIGSGVFRLEKI